MIRGFSIASSIDSSELEFGNGSDPCMAVVEETEKIRQPRPSTVYVISKRAFGTIENPCFRSTLYSINDDEDIDKFQTFCVRIDNKKKIYAKENNLMFLFEEGYFVFNTRYGIGRVIVPTKETIPKTMKELNAYTSNIKLSSSNSPETLEEVINGGDIVIVGYVGVEFLSSVPKGHSCEGRGRDRHCLWIDSRNLEYLGFTNLSTQRKLGRFNVVIGHRVTILNVEIKGVNLSKQKGILIFYMKEPREGVVELDNKIRIGHSMDGKGKAGHCINIPIDLIMPEPEIIEVEPLESSSKLDLAELALLEKSGVNVYEYINKAIRMVREAQNEV